MMQKTEAVIVTCMMIVHIGTRATAPLTAAVPIVLVARQAQRAAVHLQVKRAAALLQAAKNLIHQVHPVIVHQRRKVVLRIRMMMVIMQFMKMMITTGTATGAMMTMLPVWMMRWRMKNGKNSNNTLGGNGSTMGIDMLLTK